MLLVKSDISIIRSKKFSGGRPAPGLAPIIPRLGDPEEFYKIRPPNSVYCAVRGQFGRLPKYGSSVGVILEDLLKAFKGELLIKKRRV